MVEAKNEYHFVDYIVLALGHVPKRLYSELLDRAEYIVNPWLWEEYGSVIGGKRVGVLA